MDYLLGCLVQDQCFYLHVLVKVKVDKATEESKKKKVSLSLHSFVTIQEETNTLFHCWKEEKKRLGCLQAQLVEKKTLAGLM